MGLEKMNISFEHSLMVSDIVMQEIDFKSILK